MHLLGCDVTLVPELVFIPGQVCLVEFGSRELLVYEFARFFHVDRWILDDQLEDISAYGPFTGPLPRFDRLLSSSGLMCLC